MKILAEIKVTLLQWAKHIARIVMPEKIYDKIRIKYHDTFFSMIGNKTEVVIEKERVQLPFGVNLFAYYTNNSAGTETHLLKRALEAGNIPYQCIDLNKPEYFNSEIKKDSLYRFNLIVCHAASGTPEHMRLFDMDFNKYYNIGYWAWELPELPEEFCVGLDLFHEIWTISGFCTNSLEKKVAVPVLTVPLYANPDRSVFKSGKEYFGFAQGVFLFMFAYDCASFVSRKNPQAVVEAFTRAFSPDDCSVGLILKLISPERDREHLDELKEILSPYQNIYYIDQFLSEEEMRTLIYVSDVFVSLHRSEGFGNLPLEAMSLGTPVISTGWSGNMEYMNHMNAALVDFKMVPVDGQYVGSQPGDSQMWAEADIDSAAQCMRRMVSDKEWREKLIANGKQTADNCFTATRIGTMMYDRLKRIESVCQ